MKLISKIAILNLCLSLSQSNTIDAFLDEDFEKDFIERMDHVEKSIKAIEKNIEAQLKESHNKLLHDLNTEIKISRDYANKEDFMGNQNYIKHYQQSSNSLSFANNDKAIKIIEQKDNNTKMYTIIVIDKKSNEVTMQKSSDQVSNITDDIKELESYIRNTFHSKPAEKILEECINATKEEHKDNLVNLSSSVNGNEKKYIIEIAHKKEPIVSDIAPTKQNKKNKKNK